MSSQQVGGTTKDHATYLLSRGTADVFFPTDFRMLARLYEAAARAAPTQLTGAPGADHLCMETAENGAHSLLGYILGHVRERKADLSGTVAISYTHTRAACY